MNKDRTTCCVNRKRTIITKPTTSTQKPQPQKKRSTSPMDGPTAKKASTEKIFPASALLGGGSSAPKAATSNTSVSRSSADLVCTPDILSMFMDDEPTAAIQKTPAPRTVSDPPPLTTIRQYPGSNQLNAGHQFIRTPTFTTIQPSMPMVLNQQQVLQQVQPRMIGA